MVAIEHAVYSITLYELRAVLQVMQTYARANKLPLDVMRFMTEVTSKTVEQVTEPAAVGCYIHGLVLEGARWVAGNTAIWKVQPLCLDSACSRMMACCPLQCRQQQPPLTVVAACKQLLSPAMYLPAC
jgi:hypothetical protein